VNGKDRLVQTATILRYLAKISGHYPEDPMLAAKVDVALELEANVFLDSKVTSYVLQFGETFFDRGDARTFGKCGKNL
jgi:glutathione S-transferase